MEIWLRLLLELYPFSTDSQMGLFSKKSIEWGNWEYFLYALWASAATKIIMFAYFVLSWMAYVGLYSFLPLFHGAASYDIWDSYIGALKERRESGLPLFFHLCSLGPWERRPSKGRLPFVLDLIYQWEKIPRARKVKLQYS